MRVVEVLRSSYNECKPRRDILDLLARAEAEIKRLSKSDGLLCG